MPVINVNIALISLFSNFRHRDLVNSPVPAVPEQTHLNYAWKPGRMSLKTHVHSTLVCNIIKPGSESVFKRQAYLLQCVCVGGRSKLQSREKTFWPMAWWKWCSFRCFLQCFQILSSDLIKKMLLQGCKPVILVLRKKNPPCKVITVTKVGIHPTLSSHLSQTSISSIYMLLIISARNFLFLYFVHNKEII